MAGEDNLGPVVPEQHQRAGSLSESLLLEALNRLGLIEQRIQRCETQNESIIAAQGRDAARHDIADQSRGRMHQRVDEIALNVAGLTANVDALETLKPIVRALQDGNLRKQTVRDVCRQLMRNGYFLTTAGVSAAAGLWAQWEAVRAAVLRLLGAKVGGP